VPVPAEANVRLPGSAPGDGVMDSDSSSGASKLRYNKPQKLRLPDALQGEFLRCELCMRSDPAAASQSLQSSASAAPCMCAADLSISKDGLLIDERTGQVRLTGALPPRCAPLAGG